MKISHASIFFADDRAILDLLLSSKKFSRGRLLEAARRRGILLSSSDERDAIAKHIARLDHSWPQLTHLTSLVESAERAERWSSVKLDIGSSPDSIVKALQKIKSVRESSHEVYKISRTNGRINVTITCTTLHPGLTTLKQIQQHDIDMTLDVSEEGEVRVRHQASDVGAAIVEDLRGHFESDGRVVAQKEISLSSVADFGARSSFFTSMFALPGFELRDVTGVFTSGESAKDRDDDEFDEQDVHATGIVRTLAMRGSNVTTSSEYQKLIRDRFIYRAVWRSITSDVDPDVALVEFEAGFRNPATGTKFELAVRRAWGWNDRTKTIKKTACSTAVLSSRRSGLLRKLEDHAENVHSELMKAVPLVPPPPLPSLRTTPKPSKKKTK